MVGKRYSARAEDYVVGVIEDRGAEAYKVDIFANFSATLPALAFDGASKRNRPQLQIGDAVYCRVASARDGAEAELTCCAKRGSTKEWMTGCATFGLLRRTDATCLVACAPEFADDLFKRDAPVLRALAKHVKYEVAIGANGIVWARSNTVVDTVVIANALENAQHVVAPAVAGMVDQLFSTINARRTLGKHNLDG
ncbi:hypothetical protein M885DRAFT_547470 [Pelagophyceae sp. CCMP2097]|nr:hypothetical protein M885DRAFT_547470 [Pelagophyceae sp. CCMP2097]